MSMLGSKTVFSLLLMELTSNGMFDSRLAGGNSGPFGLLLYNMPHLPMPVTSTFAIPSMSPNYASLHMAQHAPSHASPITIQSSSSHASQTMRISMDISQALESAAIADEK